MVVKVAEEIVKLIQQKHLLYEYYGKKHIKVGEIEQKLGYEMRVTRSPIDDKDFFYRKLLAEIHEGELVIEILVRESSTHEQVNSDYRNFISLVKGNPQWERLVQARWLRKRQLNQDNEFDPNPVDLVPVFVKDGVNFSPKKIREPEAP